MVEFLWLLYRVLIEQSAFVPTADIGDTVQPNDTTLASIAALSPTADHYIYFTDADVAALGTVTAYARTILDDPDATTLIATLGLGALATKNTVATTDLDDNAVTHAKYQDIATNTVLGRTTAGSGNPEELAIGTGAGSIAAGDDARFLSAAEKTDLTDAGATTLHKHDHGGQDGLSDNDHPQYLLVADIDDTPINGETAQPISSNWAFDHLAAADPHPGYLTPTEGDAAYQPLSANLSEYAAVNPTAAGLALLDDADAAAQLATLGTAAYASGTWTPAFSGLTVVLGAGSVNYAGRWQRIGNLVKFTVTINPAGGATIAAVAGTTYCDMGVAATTSDACVSANLTTLIGLGTGAIDAANDRIYPPGWAATTNTVVISGSYEA